MLLHPPALPSALPIGENSSSSRSTPFHFRTAGIPSVHFQSQLPHLANISFFSLGTPGLGYQICSSLCCFPIAMAGFISISLELRGHLCPHLLLQQPVSPCSLIGTINSSSLFFFLFVELSSVSHCSAPPPLHDLCGALCSNCVTFHHRGKGWALSPWTRN